MLAPASRETGRSLIELRSVLIVSNSFLLLLVRHLLLEAMHLFLVAYCFFCGLCYDLLKAHAKLGLLSKVPDRGRVFSSDTRASMLVSWAYLACSGKS